MQGLMQEIPLMISSLIRYAAEYHGDRQVVSRTVEGPIHRYGYAECERRARRVANVMARLGIGHGDRVGTLAWNGYRHLELFYGVSGMGAVLHTVNPRLFTEQIVYIINHAEDRVLFVDLTFVELVERIADQLTTVEHVVVMTDEEHMPETRARPTSSATRPCSRARARTMRGLSSTSAPRPRSATPRARRAIPRACSTATARPCCTPWPPARTAPWASRRTT